MTDIVMLKLALRVELQRKIAEEGYNLETLNRAKRREWLRNVFYKGATDSKPDKYGEYKLVTEPVAAE
jgi:hypothetical protein